jgi:hypothetical protein
VCVIEPKRLVNLRSPRRGGVAGRGARRPPGAGVAGVKKIFIFCGGCNVCLIFPGLGQLHDGTAPNVLGAVFILWAIYYAKGCFG